MTGTVSLSPVVPTDHDTDRNVIVTVNGVALPVIDAINGPAQFTCQPGDVVTIVDTDVNAAGSTASDPFTVTAALPLQAPAKPTVLGVTFA